MEIQISSYRIKIYLKKTRKDILLLDKLNPMEDRLRKKRFKRITMQSKHVYVNPRKYHGPPKCKQTASHAISTRRILRQQTRNRIVRLTKVRSPKREREKQRKRERERSGRFRCATSQYLGRYNRLIVRGW